MLRKRELVLSRIMNLAQVLLSIVVFFVTDYFFNQNYLPSLIHIVIVLQIAIMWYFMLNKTRMGVVHRAHNIGEYFLGYLFVILFGVGILILETALLPLPQNWKLIQFFIVFGVVNYLVLIVFIVVFYYGMTYFRRLGFNSRNFVIVTDVEGQVFIDAFTKEKDWGYKLHSVVSYDKSILRSHPQAQLISTTNDLKTYLQNHPVDDVFYCLAVNNLKYDVNELLEFAHATGINLHIQQSVVVRKRSFFDCKANRYEYSFTSHQKKVHNYTHIKFKYLFETVLSTAILLGSLPFSLLLVLAIKLEDGGPVFFKQERIGLNGRRFICYKFRSMVVNAEDMINDLAHLNESDGPTFKIENDPRITKVGRFIRKTSLDEFPQFYNVIRGEMALVGPRPPLLKEVQQYTNEQLRRLSMKPGITCIWQVKGRNCVSFEEWMRMDLEYIDTWSLWNDLKIIVSTVGVVFKANGR